ncbi:hypothetical protein RN001_013746 [Aquatica leii]|uniref:CHK kinase-like domain-containing protein n=1 Tax=Aquatica leii TaxID=1421715 RepID=A0AAN7P4V0_9COLE|nr:hypothetical protein RN001_013746 [Aquatica leii]
MSIIQDNFPKHLLKNIINERFKSNIDIISTDVSYVVPPGENYVSELLRIVVKFSEEDRNGVQSVSLIVKSLPENELAQKYNEEMEFFSCELSIFRCILPMIEELEFRKCVAPKAYYLSTQPKNMIVIEDLSTLNYKVASRQEGLNLEHCLLSIEKLAYFHAASLALYEKNPKIMDEYTHGMIGKTEMFTNLFSVAFQETLNACEREPSLQKYYKKIKKDIKKKLYTSTERDPKFNVLNHGDFWCNNLMFQYDEDDNLKDVLFIDFQLSVFASPCVDLHYFISTSTSPEVKDNHINDIFHHYYNEFVTNVKILGVKSSILNWNDFKKVFSDKAYIGFTAMVMVLPYIKANKRDDASVLNFIKTDEEGSFRHHCFTNNNYLTAIKFLLPFYDNFGIFDD